MLHVLVEELLPEIQLVADELDAVQEVVDLEKIGHTAFQRSSPTS